MKKLKIFYLPVSLIVILFIALHHAFTENHISSFFENFFKAFRRLSRACFWRLLGHETAGYYRLFHEGGCTGYEFLKKKKRNPKGKRWVLGRGY